MTERLFETTTEDTPYSFTAGNRPPQLWNQAMGAATEHAAITKLLALGHSVAIPVLDEGIDLVVNYRTTVQVKRARMNGRSCIAFSIGRGGARGHREHTHHAKRADIYLIHAPDIDAWYCIPTPVLEQHGAFNGGVSISISLTPKHTGSRQRGRALSQWREAWHAFEAMD